MKSDDYRPGDGLIISAPKGADFLPHSYIIGRQYTKCLRCETEYESYTFSLVKHYTPPGDARTIVQSTPTDRMDMELPVGFATMKPKMIPVCGKCYCTLPEARQKPKATEDGWLEAVKRDAMLSSEAERKRQATLARQKAEAEARKDRLEDL